MDDAAYPLRAHLTARAAAQDRDIAERDAALYDLRTQLLQKDADAAALSATVAGLRLQVAALEAAVLAAPPSPALSRRRRESLQKWAYYRAHKRAAAQHLGTGASAGVTWRDVKAFTDAEWKKISLQINEDATAQGRSPDL